MASNYSARPLRETKHEKRKWRLIVRIHCRSKGSATALQNRTFPDLKRRFSNLWVGLASDLSALMITKPLTRVWRKAPASPSPPSNGNSKMTFVEACPSKSPSEVTGKGLSFLKHIMIS